MKEYVFGVDIWGTTVKLGLFKVFGDLLKKWGIETRKEHESKYILHDIVKTLEKKLEEKMFLGKRIMYRNWCIRISYRRHIERRNF